MTNGEQRMPEGARRTQCPECGFTFGTHAEGCKTGNGQVTDERLVELADLVLSPFFSPGPLDGVEIHHALLELINLRKREFL